MSLVVAQVHGSSIALVSDTQVSKASNERLGVLEGTIKCVVLTFDCTIAFAGDMEVARIAFEAIEAMETTMRKRDEVIAEVLKHHISARGERGKIDESIGTDFLLAFMSPAELVSVKKGEAIRNCQLAWVGEVKGFEAFNRALSSPPLLPLSTMHGRQIDDPPDFPPGLIAKMLDAMDEVAANTSLPTIGGLAIAAIGSGGMFRYAEHISMGGPTHEYIGFEVREVMQRGAATGHCTVFASFVLGTRGGLIPVTYFVEAYLLLVHPTRISKVPRRIRAHSFDEALHILQEKAHLYCDTSLPRQDNYLKAMSQAFGTDLARKKLQKNPQLNLTTNQWRPGGRRVPVEFKVLRAEIKFDDTRLTKEEEVLVKSGKFLLVHPDGPERYSVDELYRRLVFEYQWLPVMNYGQTCHVTVLGPTDALGWQLIQAELGGNLIRLKRLMITAMVEALPEQGRP